MTYSCSPPRMAILSKRSTRLSVSRNSLYRILSSSMQHCCESQFTHSKSSSQSQLRGHQLHQITLPFTHSAFLDELQSDLLSRRGVEASMSTLFRTLRRLDITSKKVSRRALEPNDENRAAPNPEMLMFGHEAAKNDSQSAMTRLGASLSLLTFSSDVFLVDGLTGLYTTRLIKNTILNVALSGSGVDMVSASPESRPMSAYTT
ncbi:hypothetical protein BD769DRAFT_273740 [Suillus cothurnatus]|nr:hypothetical protein BD769DRAFT_273740 [Suillus cothurnatus]